MCLYERTDYHCKDCGKVYAAELGDRQPCKNHSESNPCHAYHGGEWKIDENGKCASCS